MRSSSHCSRAPSAGTERVRTCDRHGQSDHPTLLYRRLARVICALCGARCACGLSVGRGAEATEGTDVSMKYSLVSIRFTFFTVYCAYPIAICVSVPCCHLARTCEPSLNFPPIRPAPLARPSPPIASSRHVHPHPLRSVTLQAPQKVEHGRACELRVLARHCMGDSWKRRAAGTSR